MIRGKPFQKGNIPWNKGISQWPNGLPDEIINKISQKLKGRKQSQKWIDSRVKSRKNNNNYKLSEKQKELISICNSGKKHKRSSEYKKLQSISQKLFWDSDRGMERKKELSLERKNKPRPLYMKEILKNNRSIQIFPVKDTKPERMMQLSLTLNKIPFKKHKLIHILDFYHQVDLFIEPNICIEIDGDYWHRLPKVIIRDNEINHILGKNGYLLIRLWESDIKKNAQSCAEKIISVLKQRLENKI